MPSIKYKEIYETLHSELENGTYRDTGMLPSERLLIERFGCSRNTVRRAIEALASEGYVQSIHGKGVQVLKTTPTSDSILVSEIESFNEAAARLQKVPGTIVKEFSEIELSSDEAQKTGFAPGETVYLIKRVRTLNGTPVVLDINYFLKSDAQGLTAEIASDSVYDYLENTVGLQIVTSQKCITVERATADDQKYLTRGVHDYVCVVSCQSYNSSGKQFEYTQSRHLPEHFVFTETATRHKKKSSS